jgi:hypothetical protein
MPEVSFDATAYHAAENQYRGVKEECAQEAFESLRRSDLAFFCV